MSDLSKFEFRNMLLFVRAVFNQEMSLGFESDSDPCKPYLMSVDHGTTPFVNLFEFKNICVRCRKLYLNVELIFSVTKNDVR